MDSQNHRNLLLVYQAALERVEGEAAVLRQLNHLNLTGKMSLISIGKAAPAMARGALQKLGKKIINGLIITKTGHLDSLFPSTFQCLESDHPVPGQRSLEAGKALMDFCAAMPADRPVIFCLSGGTSSLVEVLGDGFSLADLQSKTKEMLAKGMSIEAINTQRKKMSLIKGGRLSNVLKSRPIDVFVISDVKNNDLAVVGSGMLFHQNTTNDSSIHHHVIADLEIAKLAASKQAVALGYSCFIHPEFLQDEVHEVADLLVNQLNTLEPGIHIWGGEPVVNLPAQPGRGGRNQHLALLIAEKIMGRDDLIVMVAGTDGTDGLTSDAGAVVDGSSIFRGERDGLKVSSAKNEFNSGAFLEESGGLITTGPTGTNVMDLVIALKIQHKNEYKECH